MLFYGASGNGYGSRSTTTGGARFDSMYSKGGYRGRLPVGFPFQDELIGEPVDCMLRSGVGDNISVTIRFRPLSVIRFELNWFTMIQHTINENQDSLTSSSVDDKEDISSGVKIM
ncbi:hypothetical protein L1987_78485 [Smallanthus sonchifolius]|uniref:Uncharacterized protein n=1 Tax=Smallanthus sonchifolius TaxID=185202 RepID=A0ACB8ZCZ9_9ASTR|nr:hypothetical protein L1987_78485 [Smallanthus sonchifolius]